MAVLDRFRLDGQTAIVTGGDRGIGRAIAQGVAEAGADVVIANRDAEAGAAAADAIADATGVEALAVSTDVTEPGDPDALVQATVDRFGGIDLLVNNAGVTDNTPAEEMADETFERVVDINLTGAFRCARAAGRAMIDDGGGSIVNISSVSAFIANYPQPQASYNASKAGLEGLKNQLASEWAECGIRVNNVNPGYVRTEMVEQVLENDPEMAAAWYDAMLLEEMADPADIAPLVVYLASDAASYVTGTSVVIDGGYTVR
jgi:NAD(P)-dependent dehydrogenase (short-subunit alcohol dehydrogenase family)